MFNILGKLFLKFWVKFENFDKARNIETLEITVSESADITTGFNNNIIMAGSTFQVFGNIAPNEITLACNTGGKVELYKMVNQE